jgi:ribosome-binding factor A
MSRQQRVAEALRKEISSIIHDEIKDPRLGFVTITRAEVTPDLRQVKVFFSVLGKEEEHKKTKEALDSALGFIRKLIASRIRLRFTPEIIFKEDRSIEYSIRIEEVLQEIRRLDESSHSGEERPERARKEGRGEPKKSRRLHKKKQ